VLGEKEIRESLKLRDWTKAQARVRDWEAEDSRAPQPERTTIEDAWKEYLMDAEARNLDASTIRKYKLLNKQMAAFAQAHGYRFLVELDVAALSSFRAGWRDGACSGGKKLERLRGFFRFAQQRKWTPDNPASELKSPKVSAPPTMPYTNEDMNQILEACETYEQLMPSRAKENGKRIRTFVLLLRHAGTRIGDAVGLSIDRISDNRLFLYTAKSGVPVNLILPEVLLTALARTPLTGKQHWFWSGAGKLDSAVTNWRGRLQRLFEIGKIANGHAHRFRDTFAVELLLAGVPIERVSVLLGHRSVRVTEKHYAPWVQARQKQLDEDVRKAWENDPIAQSKGYTRGTRDVMLQEKPYFIGGLDGGAGGNRTRTTL
jgi:site-specific recombinase XerD